MIKCMQDEWKQHPNIDNAQSQSTNVNNIHNLSHNTFLLFPKFLDLHKHTKTGYFRNGVRYKRRF